MQARPVRRTINVFVLLNIDITYTIFALWNLNNIDFSLYYID
jgi:hypothetical protein